MIKVFYGTTKEFDIMLPKDKRPKSLTWLVSESDSENKEINVKMSDQKKKVEGKTQVGTLVARTNEYAGITESGINNFVGLLKTI
ncbi:hypothetical protein [Facklamia sp. P9177]|uniref:hypothetical protein n=1 Tax=Facklamia sp. P9177 TaxID=3421945 RepID=UPI003D17EED2